ncbi:uncharacterized protein LOC5498091 isoform X1 [Nematostella vectensis]|uniref:uncharacterized protein LOC5498091 isoform X1 n=1 Tax=Nematostella vectensis TaxID=45351 RepID=UPI002076FD2D|nr:uncharacterized protein LOC5498091 isoform X1 [Nematostella vectensis]
MRFRSCPLLLILLTIFVNNVSGVLWTKEPPKPTIVFLGHNSTGVELRWDFDLQLTNFVFGKLEVYNEKEGGSEVMIKNAIQPGNAGSIPLNTNYYYVDANIPATGASDKKGYLKLTIKNVVEQGNDGDGHKIDPEKEDVYVYRFEFTDSGGTEYKSEVPLRTYRTPSFVSYPANSSESAGVSVKLTCEVIGKPTPSVTWTKLGDPNWRRVEAITSINNFQIADRGVYICTASNGFGSNITAVSVVQYSGCTSGCAKQTVGIQMTDLTWTGSYQVKQVYTKEIKDLESRIVYEIAEQYQKQNKNLYLVEVERFRSGSVTAIVSLQQPGNTVDLKPLEDMIATGSLAGQTVNRNFVSTTDAPSPSTSPTPSPSSETTTKPVPPPDTGGISDTALYAIIGVIAAVVVIAVIILIVCFVQRKKRGDTRKGDKYQQDGKQYKPPPPASQPLTKLDDYPYDDANSQTPKELDYAELNFQNRYPNGEEHYPPPQYEPTAYAEVGHAKPNKDDSEVEWDKSVNDGMWI